MQRVVITGVGAVTGLGDNATALIEGIEKGKSAVKKMGEWGEYKGLRSWVGAPVELKNEKDIPRKNRRSMGRMSFFAVQAAEQAIADAGIEAPLLTSSRFGCMIGSTMGGAQSLMEAFETILPEKDLSLVSSMLFFQCVSHTAAMNVAQYLGIQGHVAATSAACASALQAIGAGFGLIQSGKQDAILCGGSEELHPVVTGMFDILFAASSSYNDNPTMTPRPFDEKRDGLVCGEGSGLVILEEYEHARKRGAKIYAEVVGYATCGNGAHVSQSNRERMRECLELTLTDAGMKPEDVDYVSAHGTGTLQGDQAEAEAIGDVFGDSVPVSSLKGYIGHTLGSSGAIELIASLGMMAKGVVFPTLNLEKVAEECKGILHVQKAIPKDIQVMVKNCFAFGGINASLVCKKIED